MYYRVAIQVNASNTWKWKSSVLRSLDTVFGFLRLYKALPKDRLRVFTSASREDLDDMLARENSGQAIPSVTAEQFLREHMMQNQETEHQILERTEQVEYENQETTLPPSSAPSLANDKLQYESLYEMQGCVVATYRSGINSLDSKRLELEDGVGGDHDVPYSFKLPTALPQILA